jgi:hypothetical protein
MHFTYILILTLPSTLFLGSSPVVFGVPIVQRSSLTVSDLPVPPTSTNLEQHTPRGLLNGYVNPIHHERYGFAVAQILRLGLVKTPAYHDEEAVDVHVARGVGLSGMNMIMVPGTEMVARGATASDEVGGMLDRREDSGDSPPPPVGRVFLSVLSPMSSSTEFQQVLGHTDPIDFSRLHVRLGKAAAGLHLGGLGDENDSLHRREEEEKSAKEHERCVI